VLDQLGGTAAFAAQGGVVPMRVAAGLGVVLALAVRGRGWYVAHISLLWRRGGAVCLPGVVPSRVFHDSKDTKSLGWSLYLLPYWELVPWPIAVHHLSLIGPLGLGMYGLLSRYSIRFAG